MPLPVLGSGTGLNASYFNSQEPDGTAVFSRVDGALNFNWAGTAPADGVAPKLFSVRWTGWIKPLYSEEYTFFLNAADGVRFKLDGNLLIDDWKDISAATERSAAVALQAGQLYPVEIEYFFSGTTNAKISWQWRCPSMPKLTVQRSQLYPSIGTDSDKR
jgi:mannan endo-1,4-beta-mannosidase